MLPPRKILFVHVVYYIDYSYHIVAHNIMSLDSAVWIKTFLLTFLRQESRSEARGALLKKKTGSLERPPIANITRHRMARIIEDKSQTPAYCAVTLSFSLSISFFFLFSRFISYFSFSFSSCCQRYTHSLQFLSIAMNSPRKAEARLLPDPVAPIRICDCVLTPEDLSRSFYKRKLIVEVRVTTMAFILLLSRERMVSIDQKFTTVLIHENEFVLHIIVFFKKTKVFIKTKEYM